MILQPHQICKVWPNGEKGNASRSQETLPLAATGADAGLGDVKKSRCRTK